MVLSIVLMILYIVFAPVLGGLLAGFDRVLSARLQGRKGPPLLQPFYDLFKLFSKETIAVNRVERFLVAGFLFFVIFSGGLFFFGGDLLLVFFSLTLAEIFFVMAAYAANSPYSFMGAQRELVQMMAYEPMLLLAAIGFYMACGSFAVRDVARAATPAIAFLPGIFIGFLFILIIKFRKSPFDISSSHHAHQEMVRGMTTELSGKTLALVELSHWYESILLLGVVALFILFSAWWSILLAVVVAVVAYFSDVIVDNTFSRVKWQTMLVSTWLLTLIVAVVNMVVLSIVR